MVLGEGKQVGFVQPLAISYNNYNTEFHSSLVVPHVGPYLVN